MTSPALPIASIRARAFTIPTDAPESDGTLAWDKTTLVVAFVEAGGYEGIGYTYADRSNADLIASKLGKALEGRDALDIPACWAEMWREVRNLGQRGLAATAISAVDVALWDLKAKLLDLPLVRLIGAVRDEVPIYGSGGFCSYSNTRLAEQLGGWAAKDGCRWVKMKIGREPQQDPARVKAARAAIGRAALFVDANGAFTPKQAIGTAKWLAEYDVRWFEEPVSSDDRAGLRMVRTHAPPPIEVAAGEYSYVLSDSLALLEAQAVDVLQADATRCGGVTGFLAAGRLAEAYNLDFSGHCAPAVHLHAACCVPRLRHLEWFHDHVRIEHMLFDGAPAAKDGSIRPDLSRPGLGIALKKQDAEQYADQ